MPRRHAFPAVWVFTDDRHGEALYDAIAQLPKGRAAVVIRSGDERRIRALCKARRLVCVLERAVAKAHNRRELVAARRAGARLVFLSPVFPTRSHPGARTLGRVGFGLLARGAGVPVAALGGMNGQKFQSLRQLGAAAWGGIDAFLPVTR